MIFSVGGYFLGYLMRVYLLVIEFHSTIYMKNAVHEKQTSSDIPRTMHHELLMFLDLIYLEEIMTDNLFTDKSHEFFGGRVIFLKFLNR